MGKTNDMGNFYTSGQEQCPHCSDWFPESWIYNHTTICAINPASQEETDE
jgi:hypothetical protein